MKDEDREVVRQALEKLGAQGITVLEAANAMKAIGQSFRQIAEGFDAIGKRLVDVATDEAVKE
jgi:hypothetical protein